MMSGTRFGRPRANHILVETLVRNEAWSEGFLHSIGSCNEMKLILFRGRLLLLMMMKKENIRVVAFDADDTLWDNEPFFRNVEDETCRILSQYGTAEKISESLYDIEIANMPDYGYGAVAFTMSLIENAVKVSDGKVSANDIARIIEAGRQLVRLPATPLPGVAETLRKLKEAGTFRLVVFTKGELLTQEGKLKRSGLLPFFDRVFIVTDKKEQDYRTLCADMGIAPEQLLMVGNSLRSDILPALNIGAWAVYIPYEIMWQHEVIDEFDHHQMIQVEQFSELENLLLNEK